MVKLSKRKNQQKTDHLVGQMRAWRNWQTRQTQDLVGDRGGSSPFARTKKFRVKHFVQYDFFILKTLLQRDLNEVLRSEAQEYMERATLVACLPFGKKTVWGTVLRVGRTGESPASGTTSKQDKLCKKQPKRLFFCFYVCFSSFVKNLCKTNLF